MIHECELGVVVRLQVVFDIRIYYLLHSYEIQGNLSKPNLPRTTFVFAIDRGSVNTGKINTYFLHLDFI